MESDLQTTFTDCCAVGVPWPQLEQLLQYVLIAPQARDKEKIVTVQFLVRHFNSMFAVSDLTYLFFALRTCILAITYPLVNALKAIDVRALVKPGMLRRCNFLNTNGARAYLFFLAHES